MRHLIVCADGTWNTPNQTENGQLAPTNVSRIYDALADTVDQRTHYHVGVGAGVAGLYARLAGGAFGAGLDANIKDAFAWLTAQRSPDWSQGRDLILLFGFSRGAYTVRSLAGMIRWVGLPYIPADAPDRHARIDELYDRYRDEDPATRREPDEPAQIDFLGVWDTVGSLGIPDVLPVLKDFLDRRHRYSFHDTTLGPHVVHARHAMAIDEQRAPFTPTLWTTSGADPSLSDVLQVEFSDPGRRSVVQTWFIGTHSDVGGGHCTTGLSDIALQWMIDEVRRCVPSVEFLPSMRVPRPDPDDAVHDTCTGIYHLAPRPRAVPRLCSQAGTPVHPSVFRRQAEPPPPGTPYRPDRTLVLAPAADGGPACVDLEVLARDPWNRTGVWLEPGDYRFVAEGDWVGRDRTVGWDGTDEHEPMVDVHVLDDVVGRLADDLVRHLRRDDDQPGGTYLFSRRHPELAWMCLVGAVAGPSMDKGGMQTPFSHFAVPAPEEIRHLEEGGYLYLYANDAMAFYGDNSGSVRVRIERVRP